MAVEKKDPRSGKAPKKESQPLIIAKTPAEEQRLKAGETDAKPREFTLYRKLTLTVLFGVVTHANDAT